MKNESSFSFVVGDCNKRITIYKTWCRKWKGHNVCLFPVQNNGFIYFLNFTKKEEHGKYHALFLMGKDETF